MVTNSDLYRAARETKFASEWCRDASREDDRSTREAMVASAVDELRQAATYLGLSLVVAPSPPLDN